ncbi:MAG: SCO family protein [Gammaproteobacteria bacterium]|nr:SCO family protein [Gammaproteobacteria bacterium]
MTNRKGLPLKGIIALLSLIILGVAGYFGWRAGSDDVVKAPEEIEDYLFWQATNLTDFTLSAAGNQELVLDNLKGKWSFIFFGYTHCPDVCPMTLGVFALVFKTMAKNPAVFQDIQGVFISVDPKRDTPESLKKYVSYFHSKFIGVTGTTSQIDALARQMGVLYTIHPGESEDNYLVSHNSTMFLVDPRGRLYGRFPPPHAPAELAELFYRIRTFYNEQEEKRWAFF